MDRLTAITLLEEAPGAGSTAASAFSALVRFALVRWQKNTIGQRPQQGVWHYNPVKGSPGQGFAVACLIIGHKSAAADRRQEAVGKFLSLSRAGLTVPNEPARKGVVDNGRLRVSMHNLGRP